MNLDHLVTLRGRVRAADVGQAFDVSVSATMLELGLARRGPETGTFHAIAKGYAALREMRAAEVAVARERVRMVRIATVIAMAMLLVGGAIGRASAETVDGDRITIIDGDTIALPCDPARGIYPGCAERLRLVGIDAPETGARARCEAERVAGLEARAALAEILRGRSVAITRTGRDRWGRTLARLEAGGTSVDEAMIAAGLALPYAPGRPAWAARCRHWCPGAPRCEE